MLNWVSDGAGESVSPLFMSLEPRRGAGESVPDLEGTYPPFQGQFFHNTIAPRQKIRYTLLAVRLS
jgi:hypothetical protein